MTGAPLGLNRFAEISKLADSSEISRVKLLAYFLGKSQGITEVPLDLICAALQDLHLTVPNKSRLRDRLTTQNGFVRAKTAANVKLHFSTLRAFDSEFADAFVSVGPKYRAADVLGHYVSDSRLKEISALKSDLFDFQKLAELLRELNINSSESCFFAVAMILRSVLDHVPPIFGYQSFAEVSNNYAGARSFREAMKHLQEGARKIGDLHLHGPIRKHESIPNERQVDYSQALDLLLAEIIRITK